MRNSRPRHPFNKLRSVSVFVLVMVIAPAWAASGTTQKNPQRNEPVYIQANQAELNSESHTSVYKGDVKVDQGRLHLTGNQLVVTQNKGQDSQFTGVMTGDPAHLVQDPAESGQPPTYAHAERIKYNSQTQVLHLIGKAHVRQGKNTLSGSLISYDTQSRLINANNGGQGRVHITIYPNSPPSQPTKDRGESGKTDGSRP